MAKTTSNPGVPWSLIVLDGTILTLLGKNVRELVFSDVENSDFFLDSVKHGVVVLMIAGCGKLFCGAGLPLEDRVREALVIAYACSVVSAYSLELAGLDSAVLPNRLPSYVVTSITAAPPVMIALIWTILLKSRT